ncbi:MAG: DUF1385 domain-containing protein [Anaerolineae bacterium]|jgi:uncharacterized protein YqhQ|nr:DUF1385 domain-containing protein [Anaerolineae bacterium]
MSKYHYGGQAVIEGVMMRGRQNMAVAVRKPDGEIIVHSEPLTSKFHKSRALQLPFLRGVAMLVDTLVLGIRSLMYSADVALGEEDVQFSGPIAWGTIVVSFALAIGLFFVLPLALVNLVDRYIASALVSNLLEGIVRLGIFLAYVWAIGFIPDIQRVFAYHGAEHKTVNAYENGTPLTPEAVQQHTTAHTRCGTAFLLVVAVVSIFVFAFLGRPSWPVRYASRILLIPVIAALSYEWLRFSANHQAQRWVSWISKPGLVLQRLTTREPDAKMVEVAISALARVLEEDAKSENLSPDSA